MAQRRMFSPDIVCSDAFFEMPNSSRELYFQLGMKADDDGFVNPRGIMRLTGASEDDLKMLFHKRFALPFQSGVIVIKHWKINNLVRKDWYKPTLHQEEKKLLETKENGAYTELVNDSLTTRTRRLGKVSIEKTTANADFPIRTEETTKDGELIISRKEVKAENAKYEELLQWAEKRRGFKFVNRIKQYAALKKAKGLDISISRLKERWIQLEGENWRDGFDWSGVVSSFDKKA